MSSKEIGVTFKSSLRKNIPWLSLIEDAGKANNWLVLSYITTLKGGFVELGVYRWVTINATGENVFAKVWDESRLTVGPWGKDDFSGTIEQLVHSFALDFLAAN